MTGGLDPGALCDQCATIDFHLLLSNATELELQRPVADISEDASCPFCRLMTACWQAYELKPGETKNFSADVCKVAFSSKIQLPGFQEESRVLNIGFPSAKTGYWFERFDFESRQPRAQIDQSSRRLVDSMFNVERLREWLQTCDRTPAMQTTPFALLQHDVPFRVLDIYHNRIVILQQASQYVALSYAWGYRRGKSYQPAISEVIDRTALPRTVKDVIDVTNAIGLRYIWIDYLCIDQSQPYEVSHIMSEMGAIYANSYLTIVAAGGDSVESGLSRFRTTPKTPMPQHLTSFMSHGKPITIVRSTEDLFERLDRSTWASRGWTYQEYALSRRCVIFTEHEVFFECSHGTRRREAYVPLPSNSCPTPTFARGWDGTVNEGWRSEKKGFYGYCLAVEDFSKRMLTFDGDRLDAFAGVCQRFNPACSSKDRRALSGLPLQGFREAVCWYSGNAASTHRIAVDTRGTRCIPSWSWAGWAGAISNPLAVDSAHAPPQILDAYNIVLPLSGEPVVVPCRPQRPVKCALHLQTYCLQVVIERTAAADNVLQTELIFTSPLLCSVKVSIAPSSSPNYTHLSASPREDRQHWLAFMKESQPHWKGVWLVLEGDELDAERIGVVRLGQDSERIVLPHAQDTYMRIF